MWYSSVKVGIAEIDMDHSNIDSMLQLYFADRIPQNYLGQILLSLIKHFTFEEEVVAGLGHEFPPEHSQEHQRLTALLQKMIVDWQAGKIDGKMAAEEVRSLLLLHVTEFDVDLGKTTS